MLHETKKINVILIQLLIFQLSIHAADSAIGIYSTKGKDDLRVLVAGIEKMAHPQRKESDVPRSGELLLFGVCTVTNKECSIGCPKEPKYLCTVELRDATGKLITKTRNGAQYGVKYSEFDPDSAELTSHYVSSTGGPGWQLFRVDDLFTIPSPGSYTLRIEFQLMKAEGNGTNATAKIVRFSPLEIPIRHE